MAIPVLTRTYCTRRNIPLLDTSTIAKIGQSWALALMRSMLDIEATGTLSGSRHANSVWTHLRSCDSSSVSTNPAVNLWTGLAALVNNSTGVAHSWIVMENTTVGYHCCIDLSTAGNTSFFRIVFTKIAEPFSTGTTTVGPIAANEFTVGVVAGGGGAGFTFFSTNILGGTMMFHYSASQDGEFWTLTNRIGAFCFDNCYFVQKTVGAHVSDTWNLFVGVTQGAGTSGARGVPVLATIGSSPSLAGRTYRNTSPMSTGGIVPPYFGGTNWVTSAFRDAARNEYPAFRMDLGNISPVAALRGYFVDAYGIGIEISRIGQVFPTVAGATHVVAGEMLIPFVGGSPSM